jgi:hypothetical protein
MQLKLPLKFSKELTNLSNAVEAFSSVVVKVLPSNLEQIQQND